MKNNMDTSVICDRYIGRTLKKKAMGSITHGLRSQISSSSQLPDYLKNAVALFTLSRIIIHHMITQYLDIT
jgi:hypothetical protein